jgi:hypothetical protein
MPMIPRTATYLLGYWLALVALILAGDYLTGPLVLFPIFYLIPIVLVAWHNGRWWGLVFALAMPLVRVCFSMIWPVPWSLSALAINTVIRIVVLAGFAIGNFFRQRERQPVQPVHQVDDDPANHGEASLGGRDQQVNDPGEDDACIGFHRRSILSRRRQFQKW